MLRELMRQPKRGLMGPSEVVRLMWQCDRDRQRQIETGGDRQSPTEPNRDRQRRTETDRDRQRQQRQTETAETDGD